MSKSRFLPPTYLLAGLVAMALLHFLYAGPRLIRGEWRFAGVAIAAFGAGLTIRADALFKRVGTEIKPFRKSQVIVRDGPFRFSRHPMYLGFMCIILGAAVLAGTLAPLLVVGVMFGVFSGLFAIPEERHMEEQFGQEYRQYKSEVRRWL